LKRSHASLKLGLISTRRDGFVGGPILSLITQSCICVGANVSLAKISFFSLPLRTFFPLLLLVSYPTLFISSLSLSYMSVSPLHFFITRRDILEVLCIFDMSGGTDYGGLIIDDDKNLTRKMFREGKQRKHGGNVLQQSDTFESLEQPIFSIFCKSCNKDNNCHDCK